MELFDYWTRFCLLRGLFQLGNYSIIRQFLVRNGAWACLRENNNKIDKLFSETLLTTNFLCVFLFLTSH